MLKVIFSLPDSIFDPYNIIELVNNDGEVIFYEFYGAETINLLVGITSFI